MRTGAADYAESNNISDGGVFYQTSTADTDKWMQIRRGLFGFYCASIAGAAVTSAKFSIYVDAKFTDFNDTLALVVCTPSSNTVIATSDYLNAFGSTLIADEILVSDLTLNAYNDITLNAAGLAAIGETFFIGMRIGNDFHDTEPTWAYNKAAGINVQMAENTNKPKLIVTHEPLSPNGGASYYGSFANY